MPNFRCILRQNLDAIGIGLSLIEYLILLFDLLEYFSLFLPFTFENDGFLLYFFEHLLLLPHILLHIITI
jgi:hypothetical protein